MYGEHGEDLWHEGYESVSANRDVSGMNPPYVHAPPEWWMLWVFVLALQQQETMIVNLVHEKTTQAVSLYVCKMWFISSFVLGLLHGYEANCLCN